MEPPAESLQIITIDGPCFTGKSTAAKLAAQKLGFEHLNTGFVYRGLARIWSDTPDPGRVSMTTDGILIDKEPISVEQLKNPEMDLRTSTLSKLQEVQKAAAEIIRGYAKSALGSGIKGFVTEGRNTGTFLFPNAALKMWIYADQKTRVERCILEATKGKGGKMDFSHMLAGMLMRDHQDRTRPFAPLKKPKNAIPLDTSPLSEHEVAETIVCSWRLLEHGA